MELQLGVPLLKGGTNSSTLANTEQSYIDFKEIITVFTNYIIVRKIAREFQSLIKDLYIQGIVTWQLWGLRKAIEYIVSITSN